MKDNNFGKLDAHSKEDIKKMEELLKKKYENKLQEKEKESAVKKVTA